MQKAEWGARSVITLDGETIVVGDHVWDYIGTFQQGRLMKAWDSYSLKDRLLYIRSLKRDADQAHADYQRLIRETEPEQVAKLPLREQKDTLNRLNNEGMAEVVLKLGKVGVNSKEPYFEQITKRFKVLKGAVSTQEAALKTSGKLDAKKGTGTAGSLARNQQTARQAMKAGTSEEAAQEAGKAFGETGVSKKTAGDQPGRTAASGATAIRDGRMAGGSMAAAGSKYERESRKAPPPLSAPQTKTIGNLRTDDLKKRGYSDQNIQDLGLGVANASGAVATLHDRHPSAVGETYSKSKWTRWAAGTLTNIEDSVKAPFVDEPLKRGCVSHQEATLNGLPKNTSIEYKPVVIGKVLEHHAVVAYPKPPGDVKKDPAKMEDWWKSKGVVLDGWKYQSAAPDKMTFGSVEGWKDSFVVYSFAGARLE